MARVIVALIILLSLTIGASAQEALYSDGFESSDTAAWSVTVPAVCSGVASFELGRQAGSELHVATWGSNTGGDGSAGNPYASVAHAAALATPGTAVVVHAGTYSGGIYLQDLDGTAAAPIWIGGAPGESPPHINGGNEGLHLVRGSYLVLHDLEVSSASDNGINCDDGGDYDDELATHHLVFRRLHIHDIGSDGNQDCLKLSGVNSYWVLDSQFARCGGGGSGSAIDHVGCHHGLIARNSFEELSANAVQSKGGSEDIEIRWNHFVESGQRSLNLGGSTGTGYFRPPLSETAANFEARDIRVVANLFEGSEAAVAYVGCDACVVVNNTIVDPHSWILRILQETVSSPPYDFVPCRDGIFTNNLVYFDRSDLSTYVNIGPNTAPETFSFSNNLWFAHDNPGQSQPTLPASESNGIYGLDPGFTTGYRIGGGSPAAGTGIDHQWLGGDLDGACYGSPPSIGAYEAP